MKFRCYFSYYYSYLSLLTGFVLVMENLESHGIKIKISKSWPAKPGKLVSVMESREKS